MSEENLPPSPPPSGPTPAVPATPPPPADNTNQWVIGLHLSALLGLVGCSTPGINLIGPLVIWLLKRPENARIDEVGKRVVNFQISWAIYFAVAWIIVGTLSVIGIGFLLIPLIGIAWIAWLIFTIVGAVKESNGESYQFPATIQFLK